MNDRDDVNDWDDGNDGEVWENKGTGNKKVQYVSQNNREWG